MNTTKKTYNHKNNYVEKKGGVFTLDDIKEAMTIYSEYKHVDNYEMLNKTNNKLFQLNINKIEDIKDKGKPKLDSSIRKLFDETIEKYINNKNLSISHSNTSIIILNELIDEIDKQINKYMDTFDIKKICNPQSKEQSKDPSKEQSKDPSIESSKEPSIEKEDPNDDENSNNKKTPDVVEGKISINLKESFNVLNQFEQLNEVYDLIENELFELINEIINNESKIIESNIIQSIENKKEHTNDEQNDLNKTIVSSEKKYDMPTIIYDNISRIVTEIIVKHTSVCIFNEENLHHLESLIKTNIKNFVNRLKTHWIKDTVFKEINVNDFREFLFVDPSKKYIEYKEYIFDLSFDDKETNERVYKKLLDYCESDTIENAKTIIYENDLEKMFVNFENVSILKWIGEKVFFLDSKKGVPNKFYNYIYNIIEEVENYKYDYYRNESGKYNLIYLNLQKMIDSMSCYDDFLKLKASVRIAILTINLIIKINKEILKTMFINIINLCVTLEKLSLSEKKYLEIEKSKKPPPTYRQKLYSLIKNVTNIYKEFERDTLSNIESDKIIEFVEMVKKTKMSKGEIKEFWKEDEIEHKKRLQQIENSEFYTEIANITTELVTTGVSVVVDSKIVEFLGIGTKLLITLISYYGWLLPGYDGILNMAEYNDLWNNDEIRQKLESQDNFKNIIKLHKMKMVNYFDYQEKTYEDKYEKKKDIIDKNIEIMTNSDINSQIDIIILLINKFKEYVNEHINKYYFLLEICFFIERKCDYTNINKHDFGYKHTTKYTNEEINYFQLENNIILNNILKSLKSLLLHIKHRSIATLQDRNNVKKAEKKINNELDNLMNDIERLPNNKVIDIDTKQKDIKEFYSVIKNIIHERSTELKDIRFNTIIDVEIFLNKYLYTHDGDKDMKNNAMDYLSDGNITIETENGTNIEITPEKLNGNEKYLNISFLLGNKILSIILDNYQSKREFIRNNELKLSTFFYYLYKLFDKNKPSPHNCHTYISSTYIFDRLLRNRVNTKAFFKSFQYYNKDLFVQTVNLLCNYTADSNFNPNLNYSDNLITTESEPLTTQPNIELQNNHCIRLIDEINDLEDNDIMKNIIINCINLYGNEKVNTHIKNIYNYNSTQNTISLKKIDRKPNWKTIDKEVLKSMFKNLFNTDPSLCETILCNVFPNQQCESPPIGGNRTKRLRNKITKKSKMKKSKNMKTIRRRFVRKKYSHKLSK